MKLLSILFPVTILTLSITACGDTTHPSTDPTPTAATTLATSSQATTTTAALTVDEANAIAFEHANVKESDVYDVSAEFERERDVPTYEIEFSVSRTEYSYIIHADTGEVLHFEKDFDD